MESESECGLWILARSRREQGGAGGLGDRAVERGGEFVEDEERGDCGVWIAE